MGRTPVLHRLTKLKIILPSIHDISFSLVNCTTRREKKKDQQVRGIPKFLHLDPGDLANAKHATLSFSEQETRIDVL